MAAAAAAASPSQPKLSLPLSLDSSLQGQPFLSPRRLPSLSLFLSFPRHHLSLSPLHCSPTPPNNNNFNTQTQQEEAQPQTQQTQTFLSPLSLSKLQTLSSFSRTHHLHFPNENGHGKGTLLIRPMLDPEIDAVSDLLSESFIETLFFPPNYAKLLAFLVKNYLLDRRALLPHASVLVGIYYAGPHLSATAELACTAEVSFDDRGANAASPTPVPPPDCPYICNMTVKNSLRRKGIGKRLLKTCEDLITEMTDKRDVYLHCRMVDKVPLSMYRKNGYQVVKTDSFLVWLTLQRRKYLMRKTLRDAVMDSETPKAGEL